MIQLEADAIDPNELWAPTRKAVDRLSKGSDLDLSVDQRRFLERFDQTLKTASGLVVKRKALIGPPRFLSTTFAQAELVNQDTPSAPRLLVTAVPSESDLCDSTIMVELLKRRYHQPRATIIFEAPKNGEIITRGVVGGYNGVIPYSPNRQTFENAQAVVTQFARSVPLR